MINPPCANRSDLEPFPLPLQLWKMLLCRRPPTHAPCPHGGSAAPRRENPRGQERGTRRRTWQRAGCGPAAVPPSWPVSGVICRQMAAEPWGDVAPPASPQNAGAGASADGCCGGRVLALVRRLRLLGQQPRSAKPLARGRFSLGETEARMGKATRRLGKAGRGHGNTSPCAALLGSGAPPGAAGVGWGAVGAARCPGVPGALAGAQRPRGAQPSLGAALAATGAQLHRSQPKAGGCAEGRAAPRWGSERSLVPPPSRGRDPHRAGGPGRKRLPAGLRAGYKSGPESLSGMRWHPARFPRRPRCRKYTRSWWWLPQRWAGCHIAGGHSPAPRCASTGPRHGVAGALWDSRGSMGQRGLRGAAEPGAGDHRHSRCPRLPLMCLGLRPR